ncbi:alpha/beta fold hydrolase [Deinococcus peraridilitoris]|uniref:Putative hydrolase or acyltransferase of alpha/beta superfamily n=1 Tax=Deinococcus peraridilitoris (strain DSM 19664 / LMG 22246 / CIP 109416 / KR-200) TaxID=937777 RepID=K9ZYY5_DEIPD|nr:alpha/beta hydrolase [Deinococcus peraridilitoris]AFZ66863.1 putative hydrolase or acyltransferase of alpha/beta superfamily [Deinococcus peraridilitoris DSM 19664]
MSYVTVGQENGQSIELYFEDHGSGQAVVLIHGFPLNGHSWERQEAALLDAGYRVITYDRRGFGASSKPSTGYDYDTFTRDLDALLSHLDLREVVLVGFSMGTGEVSRYLGQYGSERVSKAVLIGPIPPYLLKTADNPEGVDQQVFEGIKDAIRKDRAAYLTQFFENFYNTDALLGSRVSQEVLRLSWNVAARASARATLACVDTWLTDFRADIAKIDVPTLIIHGDADRILPFDATAKRLPELIAGSELVVIANGPHNVLWTFAEEVNAALLTFLQK